jgi:sugar-specific transcriptional regulator TrmB
MNPAMLHDIGLTDSESKVYLALLELGDSTRGDIVQRSGVAGSKIYDLLERLREKGLVSIYSKDKVKHFRPANPKQLLHYLEEKKVDIATAEKEVHTMLPALLATFLESKEEEEVEVFTGLKGFEIIFREQVETLQPGETNYVIGGTRGEDEAAVLAFFKKIHILREQKKIKTRMLFNLRQKKDILKNYSSKNFPGTTTRFIDHAAPVAINIYKDKTIITIYGKRLTAISITSHDVAKSFLEYFNMLWKQGKP